MPQVQQTFSIIPERGPRPRTNNQPIRPMTSKQVKKAYREANRKPKLSKAEQRRLELAEQERIRKEIEKEKQATRARAARERKKVKELAQKEARKRSGKPLVDVRPSQDTISRFVRGNGTGKKRDGMGTEVATKTTALAAVAEETDTYTEDDTDSEIIGLIDAEKPTKKKVAVNDVSDGPGPSPAHEIRRNSQRSSQRLRQTHDESRSSQHRKRPRTPSPRWGSQQQHIENEIGRTSQTSQVRHADDRAHDHSGGRSGQVMTVVSEASSLSNLRQSYKEPPIKTTTVQDDLIYEHSSRSLSSSGKLSYRDPMLLGEHQAGNPAQQERSLKRCESFNLDPDDLVDDESLLQLDHTLGGNSTGSMRDLFGDNDLPPVQSRIDNGEEKELLVALKNDSQSSLDFEMLETMNTVFDELTTCQPPVPPLVTSNERAVEIGSNTGSHPVSSKDQTRTVVAASDSFGDDDLDDSALLCLDVLGAKNTAEERSSEHGQMMAATSSHPFNGEAKETQRLTTPYERDLGLVPDSPRLREFVPLSTQAILSDLNEFFPSPSQQARELDDLPASNPINTPCPPTTEKEPIAQALELSPSPQLQKRFFTSSGSNEIFSLALQRSRRTAAMEELQRKERQRREAGLLAQVQKEASGREETAKWRMQQRQQPEKKVHIPPRPLPTPQVRPRGAAPASYPPRRLPPAPSRASPLGPGRSVNISATRKPSGGPIKAPQQPSRVDVIISEDRENLAHELRAHEQHNQHDAPNASQESEYGGNWIDDAWMDGLLV